LPTARRAPADQPSCGDRKCPTSRPLPWPKAWLRLALAFIDLDDDEVVTRSLRIARRLAAANPAPELRGLETLHAHAQDATPAALTAHVGACGACGRHALTAWRSPHRIARAMPRGERVGHPELSALGGTGSLALARYRVGLDTPLPALRGQTPREAAGSKAGRPRVVALLKDMESLSAYDFGWMWGDLGLDRPG
jgi:hypothetical protein